MDDEYFEKAKVEERLLYNEDSGCYIKIVQAPDGENHDIWFGKNQEYHLFLQRGVFSELGNKDDVGDLLESIMAFDSDAIQYLKTEGVPYEHFRTAIIRARLAESEKEKADAIRMWNEERRRADALEEQVRYHLLSDELSDELENMS